MTQGMRNKDDIKDQSAKSLKAAIKDLQRCGVKGYTLEKQVDALAWFVGGNDLGIASSSGRLKEDGVYGKETQEAWNRFAKKLISGSVPTLSFINPLQTNITGYECNRQRHEHLSI